MPSVDALSQSREHQSRQCSSVLTRWSLDRSLPSELSEECRPIEQAGKLTFESHDNGLWRHVSFARCGKTAKEADLEPGDLVQQTDTLEILLPLASEPSEPGESGKAHGHKDLARSHGADRLFPHSTQRHVMERETKRRT